MALSGVAQERGKVVAAQLQSGVGALAARLTPAQRAVFEQLLHGMAIRSIARDLDRTENTVRNHVKAIFKVFDVNSRAALMARANRSGA